MTWFGALNEFLNSPDMCRKMSMNNEVVEIFQFSNSIDFNNRKIRENYPTTLRTCVVDSFP